MLNTCEDSLRDKVREWLDGVSVLEVGILLALKKMSDIVVDVDDSALCSLTGSLQLLRLKDVTGKHVGTGVSY